MGPKPSLKRPGKEGKKRVRLPPMKENEAPSNAGKQKESSVLKDSSLAVLSRELGPEKYNGLVLGMLLNIPTITLVRIANDASECGLKDASDKTK
uniref:Uncharacterized protein n=1 Tax=Pinctada fucata TaxID=50426 RepID=A0A194AMW6_PINFU